MNIKRAKQHLRFGILLKHPNLPEDAIVFEYYDASEDSRSKDHNEYVRYFSECDSKMATVWEYDNTSDYVPEFLEGWELFLPSHCLYIVADMESYDYSKESHGDYTKRDIFISCSFFENIEQANQAKSEFLANFNSVNSNESKFPLNYGGSKEEFFRKKILFCETFALGALSIPLDLRKPHLSYKDLIEMSNNQMDRSQIEDYFYHWT